MRGIAAQIAIATVATLFNIAFPYLTLLMQAH
jgi:hypothetical protein